MADNARTPLQRLKILYLYNILTEHTDEDHGLTMPDIISKLEACGISAARKALYEDIEALRCYGLDIVDGKGRNADYRVVSREFELPELKLLADAVSSSKFLTEKKSNQLIDKIGKLCSMHQAKQLRRQVFVSGRVKAMNEALYINIDAINTAISEGKRISFRYFDYDTNKRKRYRDKRRECTPYQLVWDDEKYYLIGYHHTREAITNFRVDRMENVTVEDIRALPLPNGFAMSEYLGSTFSMFAGEVVEVKLLFTNDLVNVVIDRFGKDTKLIPYDDEHFTINAHIKAEAPFFGWLFQFGGKVRILSPDDIIARYRDMLDKVRSSL
ncbi:MAG: WYL domain-containing protein [Oscillospiraceae bacterium]|nr:WYL domain-containing protein [Oscillospiraceae bacterium]